MKQIQDKSILVIDDDQGMLRALEKVLTGAGAMVAPAENAADAVEILAARQMLFDLVITDLRMPFVTGLTVVYAIHKIHPGLPVIVLTAFGSADVRDECFRQGAVAFLEKPLDAAELLDAIGKVFNQSNGRPGGDSRAVGPDAGDLNSDKKIVTDRIRLNVRSPMPGLQNRDTASRARNDGGRTEQSYEYQLRSS